MASDNGIKAAAPEIGRRSFLKVAGASAVALTGSGFFHTTLAAAGPFGSDRTSAVQAEPTFWSSERIYTGGVARAWTFDGNAGGWAPENGLAPFSFDGGMLHTAIAGSDPNMITDVDLVGLTDHAFMLRMKVTPGGSPPDNPGLRVYFETTESPDITEEKSVRMPITADGEFHDHHLDPHGNPLWRCGTIRRIRLGFEGLGAGTQIVIDQVRVETNNASDEHWFVEPLVGTDTAMTLRPGQVVNADLQGMRDRILHLKVRLVQPAQDGWPDPRLGLTFATAESPGTGEPKVVWFHVPSDGEFHEMSLDLGALHPLWRSGTIKRVGLGATTPNYQEGDWEFEFVRIERMGPRLAMRPLTVDQGAVGPGDSVTLSAAVANVGATPSVEFPAVLVLPDGVTPSGSELATTVPELEPFAAPHELSWEAKSTADAPAAATLALQTPTATHQSGVVLPLVPAVRDSDARAAWANRVLAHQGDGQVVLSNSKVQAVFARSAAGFGQLLFSARVDDEWRRVATSQPLSSLLVATADGGAELLPVVPSDATVGDDHVTLTGAIEDSAGTTWSVELDFRLAEGRTPQALAVEYRVTPNRDAQLLSFRGPSLTPGQGGSGGSKSAALFPGVEWLVDDERSSSRLDIYPRVPIGHGSDLRTTPHPMYVTMPLMAVAADGVVVAMQWDTNQEWDGQRRHPKAMFASPNWLDGQDNHLMALSLPAVGGWEEVPPGSPYPAAPYQAKANRRLTVTAHYTASVADDVLAAVDDWHALHGIPQPAQKPFSYHDELELTRTSYIDSYWSEEAEGFYGVHGREIRYDVMPAIALLITGHLATDQQAKDAALARVDRFLARTLREKGPTGPSNSENVNVAGWMHHGPFYLGHLEDALPAWASVTQDFLDTQHEDGNWGFSLRKWNDQMLGILGTPVMGRTARNGHHLLRYARMVGNSEARAAGLKAVDYLNRLSVPRAAQEWEVPVHTPDVLAAAYSVLANGEAYRATGDQSYLDRGHYWAKTAIPFLYHWNEPGMALQKYASIPVLGASRYRNSWFCRPVQWNGLMLALFLQDFLDAIHDPNGIKPYQLDWDQTPFPYKKVVDGLLISAMHQQRLREPARGGYPDNWYLIGDRTRGVVLGPQRVLFPLLLRGATDVSGRPVDAQTAVLNDDVRLSTAADVRSAALTDTALTAELGFFDGATSQLMITGFDAPSAVNADGRALSEVPSLDDAEEGWKRSADGTVLIKMQHRTTSTLDVRR